MSVNAMVVSANLRRPTSKDHGSIRWASRGPRLVRLLRSHNPDVVLAQECDEMMTPYVAGKTGMVAVKPTPGNRVVFYRKGATLEEERHTDLGEHCYAVAAKLAFHGATAWYVTVHLEPDTWDKALHNRQIQTLRGWLAQMDGPVIVGGDWATEGAVSLPGWEDSRRRVSYVPNATFASRHTWTRRRRKSAWVDRILVGAGATVRFVQLILTDHKESDHHWVAAGITLKENS